MKIVRATHMGMCFGVRDAIELARSEADKENTTILGDLVHNESVMNTLAQEGVHVVNQVDAIRTNNVMITAHGASNTRIAAVKRQGHKVIEATCPLVKHAHKQVLQLCAQGFHPIIIGKRSHIEVKGLTEDLETYDVIEQEKDVFDILPRAKFGVVAQTTQPVVFARQIVEQMQRRFPTSTVRYVDTICQPTKMRQSAVVELAQQCDVVIVVGGAHSNNTRQLATTCERFGAKAYRISSVDELRSWWFNETLTVGLTAGTSTPSESIDSVEAALQTLALHERPQLIPNSAPEISSALATGP